MSSFVEATPGTPARSASSAISIWLNGEARQIAAGASVAALVAELGLTGRKIAIAIGRDVVPRGSYAARVIQADDRIEILEAVGGG